ncbi:MAG: alpha/beta hydrolase [Myxococcales bacterium]|nr:alpha/beta hydrolase [Myxococcales bacterium]
MKIASLPAPIRRLVGAAAAALGPVVSRGLPRLDGETLDAEVAFGLWLDRRFPALWELPPDRARSVARRRAAPFAPVTRGQVTVNDAAVPGPTGPIRARVYRPQSAPYPSPGIVWFHGGGWTIGSIEADDDFCRWLADRSSCVVVSVQYRLGPEHRFPAAHEDADAAWRGIHGLASEWGLDPTRLAVAGSSAGGNLAGAVCNSAVAAGLPAPFHQVLFYPATDLRRGTRSHQTVGDGFVLDRALMDWFIDQYTAPGDITDPRVSILLAPSLVGVPPATVVVAGFDPLRDEGVAYAERLVDAGVECELVRAGSLVHGFAEVSGGSRVAASITGAVVDALAARLNGTST